MGINLIHSYRRSMRNRAEHIKVQAEKPGGSLVSMSSFLCGLGLILFPGWSSVSSSMKWQFRIRSGAEDSFTLCATPFWHWLPREAFWGPTQQGRVAGWLPLSAKGLHCRVEACLISTGPLAQKASDPDGLSTHCTHEELWGRQR